MSDIAEIAGVSVATVSRALAGNELINIETRKKIQQIASEHNYRINADASNLRLRQRLSIGVLIPSSDEARWQISDSFFLELIGRIAVCLSEKGHDMVLSSIKLHDRNWSEGEIRITNFDGLIVIGQSNIHDRLNALAGYFSNVLVWGAQLPDQKYPTIGSDNRLGGKLVTDHLIEQGCKRIAFLGDRGVPEDQHRYLGYCDALVAAGLNVDEQLMITSGAGKRAGYASINSMLETGLEFDGLFAASDALAIASIRALCQNGISVPGDVLVAGYDDITISSYYTPSITTIRQDRSLGGALLVDEILKMIEGKTPESHLIPTELIVRDSTRRPAGK